MRVSRVAIHGVPRSGTSWLGAILDSHPSVQYRMQPLFSYAFKDGLDLNSSRDDIIDFYDGIIESDDAFINQTDKKREDKYPVFAKTKCETAAYKEARYHHILPHILATDTSLKAILILRHPLSVLDSWRKAPKEFDSELMDFETEWRKAETKNAGRAENYYGFDKWLEFTLMARTLKSKYPDRVHLVFYHRLLKSPITETEELFRFLHLDMDPQTLAFLNGEVDGDVNDAYSVFRAAPSDNQWVGKLDDAIVKEIEMKCKSCGIWDWFQ